MSSYTSSVILSIGARDLTAGGLTSVVTGLAVAMGRMQEIQRAGQAAMAATQAASDRRAMAAKVASVQDAARQSQLATRLATTQEAATVSEGALKEAAAVRASATAQVQSIQMAAHGKDEATRLAARTQVEAVRAQTLQQTAAVSAAARDQVRQIRAAALQAAEATRVQSREQIASIESVARKQSEEAAKSERSHGTRNAIIGGVAAVGLGVGASVVAGVVDATKQAQQFQTMTQQVQNNSTMTTADLGRMRAAILSMGMGTNVPLDQLSEGFRKSANLGFSLKQSMDIVKEGMMSASSTGDDAGKVIGTLAQVMKSFGPSAGSAAHAMDVLHLAAAQGNTTLGQFTEGGSQALNMAANMKIPFQQAAAALSALSRHESINDANTQITGMLSKIVNPAKAAQKELASLSLKSGIDLLGDFTSQGAKVKGLTGIMADLKRATGGDTSEMFKLVPALRGGLAAMLLTGTATGDYRNILTSLNGVTNKGGITAGAFARAQHTAGNAIGLVKNQIHVMAIQLGTQFLPMVAKGAQWVGSMLPKAFAIAKAALPPLIALVKDIVLDLLSVSKAAMGTIGPLLKLAGGLLGVGHGGQDTAKKMKALADLIVAGITIYTGYKTLIGGVTLATKAWSLITETLAGKTVIAKAAVAAWNIVTKAAAAAQWVLNAALDGNPIGIVVLAIAGLVAGVILAYKNVAWFREGVNNLWKIISDGVTKYLPGFASVMNTMVINPLKTVISTVMTLISDIGTLFGMMDKGPSVKIDMAASSQLRLKGKDEGAFGHGLATKFGGTGVGSAYWDYAMLTKGVSGYWTDFVKTHKDVAAQYLALLKREGNTAAVATIQGLLDASRKATTHGGPQGINLGGVSGAVGPRYDPRASMAHGDGPTSGHPHLTAAAAARANAIMGGKPRKGVIGGHDYNADISREMVQYRSDLSILSRNVLDKHAQAQVSADIKDLGKLYREGHLTDQSGLLATKLATEITKAEQRPPRRGRRGYVGGHDYAPDVSQASAMESGDMTLYRQGLISQTQVLSDIANVARLEKAGQLPDTTLRMRDALKAYTASQTHHEVVKAAAVEASGQRKAAAAQRTDQSSKLQTLLSTFRSDVKTKDPKAAQALLPSIGALDYAIQYARTHSVADATAARDALVRQLGLAIPAANATALRTLLAPRIGSGLGRGQYGYTSRQRAGGDVGYGDVLVGFGAMAKNSDQEIIARQDRQIAQLETQNATLTALLSASEGTRDATVRVGDVLSRIGQGGGPPMNPLRSRGSATALVR